MILDGHIHIDGNEVEINKLKENFKRAGVDGGIIFSLPPPTYLVDLSKYRGIDFSSEGRLDNLMEWAKGQCELYPFYWIDPMAEDAKEQVKFAESYGVDGYKVICNNFYPSDPKALEVFGLIAKLNKPILFHSGILWDGTASSRYNRPVHFEALLGIKDIRFALAHVSWPWHDECLAVYGKMRDFSRANPTAGIEMFLDLTPGTPKIYREELYYKIFNIGYNIENNLFFGTDCTANNYNVSIAEGHIKTDKQIMNELEISGEAMENIFSKNLKRFLGKTI